DSIAHDSQSSLAFGNEDGAIGQESKAPWMRQSFRHDDDADVSLLGGLQEERTVAERRRHPCNWRRGDTSEVPRRGIWIAALLRANAGGGQPRQQQACERKSMTSPECLLHLSV